MRAGFTASLEERLRRPDATGRLIPIMQAVAKNADGSLREHLRMRRDQWQQADDTSAFSLLPEGDVRLQDTIVTLVQNTTAVTAYFADLNRATPWDVPCIEWGGTEPADSELQRLKLWLNPRVSAGLSREVVQWKVELLRLARIESQFIEATEFDILTLAPLCDPVTVNVSGDSEGLVTFDFTTLPVRPQPKRWGVERLVGVTPDGNPTTPPAFYLQNPVTLVFIYALKADGSSASNVGLGYDVAASVSSGGNVLRARHLTDAGVTSPSWSGLYQEAGAAGGTPRMSIETGAYVSATLTFSRDAVSEVQSLVPGLSQRLIPQPFLGGGISSGILDSTFGSGGTLLLTGSPFNRFDLGGTPTGDVLFTITGSVPAGTTLTGQVLKDAGDPSVDADWVTFLSGQKSTDLVNVSKRQTYALRAKILTNAGLNLTPTLTSLGVQEVTETNLDGQCTLSGGNWSINPVTLKGEIPEVTLTAIHDGLHDYRDAITDLLANNHIGDLVLRLYWGDSVLGRESWLHVDDFLIDGSHPRGPDVTLKCLSVLCLLRDLVPRYEPGEVQGPNGDTSVGAWTTEAGATTALYTRINETSFDDTTYVRSEVNPVNSVYEVKLPTPTDPIGRKHYLDYRYQKDSTDEMTLTVEWRHGTTVIASLQHLNIPAEPTGGSFSLTDEQVASGIDYANLRVRFIANKVSGGGSTRVRVSWNRDRFGGKRDALAYVNASLKTVYEDLLRNQLAVDPRYQGPGVADDVTVVTKTLSTPQSAGKPTSKAEVDAIAALAGGGIISSQGRITFRELYGTRPIRAIFPTEEIKVDSAGPGYEERLPEYFVLFDWDEVLGEFGGEARSFHAGALLHLGKSRLGGVQFLDDEVSKWVPSETLANTVGNRQTTAIGPGLLEWRFTSIYPYPELEPGDGVLVQTDQFIARDPNVSRALRGMLWAFGVVRSVDLSARRFVVWIRNYADILPENENVVRSVFAAEDPTVTVGAHSLYALRHLYVVYMGGVGTQSVRIATSLTGYPAVGQGTVTNGQVGTVDTGAVNYNTDVYITVTPYGQLGGMGFPGAVTEFKANYGMVGPLLIKPGTGLLEDVVVPRASIGPTFAQDLASSTSRSRLFNGGFQDGLIYWNSNPTSIPIVANNDADTFSGTFSCAIPHTGGAQEYIFQSTEPREPVLTDAHPGNWALFAVRPSRKIQVDYTNKVSGAGVIGRVYVAEYSASGGLLGTTQIGTDVTSTIYVSRSEEFTVGATTFWVVIRFAAEGASSGTVWYDELYFTDLIPPNDIDGALGLTLIDTQVFTGNGTWTKPAGAILVLCDVIGAGGGGGGARGAPAGNIRQGGGGGGGGARSKQSWRATDLGATETVVVGTAGTAGGGGTVGDGGNGGAGGDSRFGVTQYAFGGGGGALGSNSATARCGGSGGGSMSAGTVGGTSAIAGGAPSVAAGSNDNPGEGGASANVAASGRLSAQGGGSGGGTDTAAGAGTAGGNSLRGGAGGASGGGVTGGNVESGGGNGGGNGIATVVGGTAGAVNGGAGGAGGNGDQINSGAGGGGGGGQDSGTGGGGGAGGVPGGGGGGGGGGTQVGGSGGAGGRGEVRVYSYA